MQTPKLGTANRKQNTSVGDKSGFRPEIQALRALAVTLVVVYHLAPVRLSGGFVGVDIFLVISGYLITSHLLRELRRTGTISLPTFYARRIRRLLPASLLVLLVTGIAALVFMPRNLWSEVGRQIIASAFYVENWALATNAVNYSALSADASPVQHFWSLSVEEQFYLVWPIALLGLFLLVRRLKRPEFSLFIALSLIMIASLAYSVWITSFDPAMAYFVTPARIWEFAVGGLVCFARPISDRLKQTVPVISSVGLALILSSAFLMSDETPFPGSAALVPVVGAALVILVGSAEGTFGRIASFRPVQYLGDISYSVYLWHWPLIIMLPFAIGVPLSTSTKLIILLASLLLGALTKKYVEDRFRVPATRVSHLRWGANVKVFAIALSMMVVVTVPAGALAYLPADEVAVAERNLQARLEEGGANFGAAASSKGNFATEAGADIVPAAVIAGDDSWTKYAEGCQERLGFEGLKPCVFGSEEPEALRVALVGDSHAGQWQPAVAEIAEESGWHLTTFVRSSCPLSKAYPRSSTSHDNACQRWIDAVLSEVTSGEYDVVVVSALQSTSYLRPEGAPRYESAATGIAEAWQQIMDSGVRVVALRDNPNPARAGIDDIPGCVANAENVEACSFGRRAGVGNDPQVLAAEMTGATLVSMTEYFCNEETCPAVIGDVLVYQNITHVTTTFMLTLVPFLSPKLVEAVEG
jgi:peptidoglycan/LPS O-acetylase OafA/YrhL